MFLGFGPSDLNFAMTLKLALCCRIQALSCPSASLLVGQFLHTNIHLPENQSITDARVSEYLVH